MQALRKAFQLALGRAPHNWVTTTSLSTLSSSNVKLNEMNKSQTTVCQEMWQWELWLPDTDWLTGEKSGPGNCIQSSWSARVECHLHSRRLRVRKKTNRHVCFDRYSSRRKKVFPDFVCESSGISLCEQYSPDLQLLSLSVLLDRRL